MRNPGKDAEDQKIFFFKNLTYQVLNEKKFFKPLKKLNVKMH